MSIPPQHRIQCDRCLTVFVLQDQTLLRMARAAIVDGIALSRDQSRGHG